MNLRAEQLRFSLVENALDYIATASGGLAGKPDSRALKYGVLHLWSGLVLLLKERLRREHWSLLYDRPGDADLQTYQTGEFKGVSYSDCLTRLSGVCGVKVLDAEQAKLDRVRRIRNKLEHFEITESAEAVKAATAAALNFTLDFIEDELGCDDLSPVARDYLTSIRSDLRTIEAFVKARWDAIRDAVGQEPGGVEICPVCFEEAVAVDDGATCLFCNHRADGESFAVDFVTNVLGCSYYEHVKEGGESPLERCPNCGVEAFVPVHESSATGARNWRCFACGDAYSSDELDRCEDCSSLYPTEVPGMIICGSCLKNRMDRE